MVKEDLYFVEVQLGTVEFNSWASFPAKAKRTCDTTSQGGQEFIHSHLSE